MQSVSFKSIDELLEFLPAQELKIVEALRSIIFSSIPDCTEKLSYNVPFYKRHLGICFIWPGSIEWGNVKAPTVRFGFMKGHLLNDDINYLDKGNRKQVYWRDFNDVREIDVDLLKSYIFEAVAVDEEIKALKRKKKNHSLKPI